MIKDSPQQQQNINDAISEVSQTTTEQHPNNAPETGTNWEQVDIKNQQSPHQYKLYRLRYAIIFFFAMAEFCNTFVYPTCNPIAINVMMRHFYDQDASVVSMTATLYLLMHPFFTFPASYLIIAYGGATSIRLGAFLTLLGVSCRCLVQFDGFYWVLVGQVFSGIGRPFILNAQASVAQNWFPYEMRTTIMTYLNFMVTLSGLFGYAHGIIKLISQIVSSLFFWTYQIKNDTVDYEGGKRRFLLLLYSEAAVSVIFLVPLIIIVRTRPPTPPSGIAGNLVKVNFFGSIKSLFTDFRFIVLFLSFSMFYGSFKGFGVSLPYMIHPFGYDSTDIAILGSMPVIGGFISSMLVSKIYKRWGRYKPMAIIFQLSTMAMFFLFYYACYIQMYPLLIFSVILIGFFMMPTIPLLLEWGCKQTFPINDSFAIGIMYSGATLMSSFMGEIISIGVGGNNSTKRLSFYGILIFCACFTISASMLIPLRELKHKKYISIHQSFHSLKPIHDGKYSINSDLFATFPQSCPEGGDLEQFGYDPLANEEVYEAIDEDQQETIKTKQ